VLFDPYREFELVLLQLARFFVVLVIGNTLVEAQVEQRR
jgi:hypothetical protein